MHYTIEYVDALNQIPYILQKHQPKSWQVIEQRNVTPKYAVIMGLERTPHS